MPCPPPMNTQQEELLFREIFQFLASEDCASQLRLGGEGFAQRAQLLLRQPMWNERIARGHFPALSSRSSKVFLVSIHSRLQLAQPNCIAEAPIMMVQQPASLRYELFLLGHRSFEQRLAFFTAIFEQNAAKVKVGRNMVRAQSP